MNLSNMTIIFVIVMIPIILISSYYISLQTDTVRLQTTYDTYLRNATKVAIDAFEINTVDWNYAYSETGDSKRRDIMASINTFIRSFANSTGVGGSSKDDITAYVPAIAFTLYDGYYIYSPSETLVEIIDEKEVAVTMNKELDGVTNYSYTESDEGKILYEYDGDGDSGGSPDGYYKGIAFTFNSEYAKTDYSYVLKPFNSYSARYETNTNTINVVVNYTLDNYITVYGTVNGDYVYKAGYLLTSDNDAYDKEELLTETVAYIDDNGDTQVVDCNYVYADDNTKVYSSDGGNTFFAIGTDAKITNLSDKSGVTYKKLYIGEGDTDYVYIALCDGTVRSGGNTVEIKQGYIYTDKIGTEPSSIILDILDVDTTDIRYDYSAYNYYKESVAFTEWVTTYLSDIKITDIKDTKNDESNTYYNVSNEKLFSEASIGNGTFDEHKREVIKQTLVSNLREAITGYSRNESMGTYQLPVLTETDWDKVLSNVSIIAFVQGIPIGTKYYSNYSIVNSNANNEFVNADEIYLNGSQDNYYHLLGCNQLTDDGNATIVGYRNIDYNVKSIEDDSGEKTYYYSHNPDFGNNYNNVISSRQECYYCLVDRNLKVDLSGDGYDKQKKAYNTALARERYNNRTSRL